jgi:hypothetical protein
MAKKPDTAKTGNKQANKQEKNRGLFKPGQSGNPKGRPRTIEDKELKELEKLEKGVNALEGDKHVLHAPDPAKVLQAVGLGMIKVAREVNRLIDKSKSDTVRIRSLELAAKIHRMVREDDQQVQGVSIILEGPGAAVQVNLQGPPPTNEPPDYTHPQPSTPGKPITIIK